MLFAESLSMLTAFILAYGSALTGLCRRLPRRRSGLQR
jgi:hypothetical protein